MAFYEIQSPLGLQDVDIPWDIKDCRFLGYVISYPF